MSNDTLEREIGQAAAERLRAKGWTIQPPKPPKPEPKRLVTMEESRERFLRVKLAISGGYPRSTAERWWDEAQRDLSNDADSWLVRTVNRRIIEGLPECGGRRLVGGCTGFQM